MDKNLQYFEPEASFGWPVHAQVMAWCQTCIKPLPEPMMTQFTDINTPPVLFSVLNSQINHVEITWGFYNPTWHITDPRHGYVVGQADSLHKVHTENHWCFLYCAPEHLLEQAVDWLVKLDVLYLYMMQKSFWVLAQPMGDDISL